MVPSQGKTPEVKDDEVLSYNGPLSSTIHDYVCIRSYWSRKNCIAF